MSKPALDQVPEFYQNYVRQVPEGEVVPLLEQCGSTFLEYLHTIPEEKGDFAYADGKWTIKQLLLHIIDAERVFCYRAMRFSRNDKTDLPGFDQDAYVIESKAEARPLDQLITEYDSVRQASISLFKGLSEAQLHFKGTANGYVFDASMTGYILIGHQVHHYTIMKDRYGL
ncbi:MAG: DinB family protein [Cyclobacteriaceae bacterium]|nr:DinB family protein [Cyclobacteriaceae bacterium HetDA_MAG_MS6]